MNNLKNIDRTLLRCFDALMVERSVSRAADRIGISQPTMSNALARLRKLFGDPLLLRARSEMMPTARALELLTPVRRMLADIEGMLDEQRHFDPATSQVTITLTALEHVEYTLLPALTQRLQRDAPLVNVEMRSINPEKALDWLERGELDYRLGWLRNPPPSLRFQALYRDKFVCLARAGHSGIGDKLTLNQYMSLAHVCVRSSSRSEYWRTLNEAFSACSSRPRIAFMVQDFMVVPRMVATTDLIATVPERFARSVAGQFSLRIIKPPLDLSDICISAYWHERTHTMPMHQWFRRMLADISRTL
jgi:DNA-binding transcriptional LysR family regulator